MTTESAFTLPNGYWANGVPYRQAHVRALTGEDHLYLAEACGNLLPATWTTEALLRCVTLLGADRPDREAIRQLTAGDREALLLNLRRVTCGDRLPCLLTCPSCGNKLDLELNAAELLVPPASDPRSQHELRGVVFRLPTGADQEAVAALARTDVVAAASLLLRRCVEGDCDGLEDELQRGMAELDAQAEIALDVNCGVCGASFRVIFDTAGYLMQELKAGLRELYREIHLLAFHYHWSLTEILRMNLGTRRRFLQLLESELARGASS